MDKAEITSAARRALDILDEQNCAIQYAKTYAYMLDDLLDGNDDFPDGLDINHPASRIQRMYACLEAIRDKLGVIEASDAPIRSALLSMPADQEASHA